MLATRRDAGRVRPGPAHRLTPIGDEGDGTGLLAIDGDGRVFLLDHAGDWFLGDTIEDALTTLVLGLQPPRVRRDGTW